MKNKLTIIALAILPFCFSSCDKVPEELESARLVDEMKLNISESGFEIVQTRSHQLSVELLPEGAVDSQFVWVSSDPEVVSISEEGLITAVSEGQAIVGAQLTNGRRRAVTRITVLPYVAENPIKTITLDKTEHVFASIADDPVTLKTTLQATNPAEEITISTLRWSSDNKSVVQVDENGKVVIIGGGEAKVRCDAIDGGKAFAECRFVVPGNEIKDLYYDATGPQFADGYYKKVYGQVEIEVPVLDNTGNKTGQTEKQVWLDRNLGAERRATESAPGAGDAGSDHKAFGSLFQWGRKADGHEKVVWDKVDGVYTYVISDFVTAAADDRANAGHSSFIQISNDWCTSTPEGLWGGTQFTINTGSTTEAQFEKIAYHAEIDHPSQANNPCPYGYRVPTILEYHQMLVAIAGLDKIIFNNNGNNVPSIDVFTKEPMCLAFAGNRANAAAGQTTLSNSGVWIMLWTNSAQKASHGWPMRIQNTGKNFRIAAQQKANGYAIRCIKDSSK